MTKLPIRSYQQLLDIWKGADTDFIPAQKARNELATLQKSAPVIPLWLCPRCGNPMTVIERLTPAQLQLRSPPCLAGAAA